MTDDTTTSIRLALPQLEERARELFAAKHPDDDFNDLDQDAFESWIEEARRTAPTARRQVRRGLNLEQLPPLAIEAVQETGIDPRTHHKKEHRELAQAWSAQSKALKLLARPGPEDEEIRRELQERGFAPFTTAEGVPATLNPVIE